MKILVSGYKCQKYHVIGDGTPTLHDAVEFIWSLENQEVQLLLDYLVQTPLETNDEFHKRCLTHAQLLADKLSYMVSHIVADKS